MLLINRAGCGPAVTRRWGAPPGSDARFGVGEREPSGPQFRVHCRNV